MPRCQGDEVGTGLAIGDVNNMNKSLLLGWGPLLLRIPRPIWQQEIARSARAREKSLAFMTPDPHRIRDFVVRELPYIAGPIPPETIVPDYQGDRQPGILPGLAFGVWKKCFAIPAIC